MDCICGAIFDEEGEEVGDAVEKDDDNDSDGDEEDGKTAAHGGRLNCRVLKLRLGGEGCGEIDRACM